MASKMSDGRPELARSNRDLCLLEDRVRAAEVVLPPAHDQHLAGNLWLPSGRHGHLWIGVDDRQHPPR